jgi:sec-independent protein translocase protein TatB
MFDVGWSELVVIAVVALVVIGPKELPGVLRSIGFWMGKVRRMASEFQGQFQEAMREAEMADLKKQVDDLNTTATDLTNFDPLADAQKQIDSAFEDKPSDSSADTPPSDTATVENSPPPDAAPVEPDEPAPKKQAGA